MIFTKNIEKNYSLREKCPNLDFSGSYFPAFGLNTETYSVFGHFSRRIFVKLLLVASSWWQPQVILFSSWNLACLNLDAIVLQFLKNSSSVFSKGFQIEVIFLFYNSGLAVFQKDLSVAAFVPLLLFFS